MRTMSSKYRRTTSTFSSDIAHAVSRRRVLLSMQSSTPNGEGVRRPRPAGRLAVNPGVPVLSFQRSFDYLVQIDLAAFYDAPSENQAVLTSKRAIPPKRARRGPGFLDTHVVRNEMTEQRSSLRVR